MAAVRRKEHETNQITEGVIWKQLLFFFFPILFGTFFQQLYNTVDAIVVGQFVGTEALAAVGGSAAQLINLLVGFFTGLASGATVIISQYYGAKQEESVRQAVHTAIALAIVGGAAIMLLGEVLARLVLVLMSTPEDTLDLSVRYLRIYFLGTIPSMIYNIGSGVLRAVGDSRRPLYFLICSCLVNIALDLLFVVALGLGVTGVAVATISSQAISAVLVLVWLMRSREAYQLHPTQIRFHGRMLKEIIRIGLPAGLQSSLYSISNLLVQTSVNSFGTASVAAWTAYGKIDGIFWMIMNAFGISITTFAGQNFGARKLDRVKKSVRVCLTMAVASSILLSVIVVTGGQFFLGLFTDDANVVEIGYSCIKVVAPCYFTYVCIEILGGATRGCGDAIVPTVMTAIGVCAVRVLWVFIAVPLNPQMTTVAFCYPLTWSLTSIACIIYYLRGKWLKRCLARG